MGINNSIQNQANGFNTNHIEILFTEYREKTGLILLILFILYLVCVIITYLVIYLFLR